MVKDFKGEVKVSDVQKEFDDIVNRINNMVTTYNDTLKIESLDYTVGGVNLSPSGYTLTVGGLKQGIKGTHGSTIGGKCCKIDDKTIKISDGIVITPKGFHRLPDSVITTVDNSKTLYYNTKHNKYQWLPGYDYKEVPKTTIIETEFKEKSNEEGYYTVGTNGYQRISTNQLLGDKELGNQNRLINHFYDPTDADETKPMIRLNIEKYPYINLGQDEVKLHDITITADLSPDYFQPERGVIIGGYLFGTLHPNQTGVDTEGNPIFEPLFEPKAYLGLYSEHGSSIVQVRLTMFDERNVNKDKPFVQKGQPMWWLPGKPIAESGVGHPCFNPKDCSDGITYQFYTTFTPKANTTTLKIWFEPISENSEDRLEGASYYLCLSNYKDGGGKTKIVIPGLLGDMEHIYAGNVCIIQNGTNENMTSRMKPSYVSVNSINIETEPNVLHYLEAEAIGESPEVVRICDINLRRDSLLANDNFSIQSQDFPGYYKITSESRTFGGDNVRRTRVLPNTDKAPQFVAAVDGKRYEREAAAKTYLCGDLVSWNRQTGHKNLNYWTPVNMLFLPRKVKNPYNVVDGDVTKTYNVLIDKKVLE